MPKVSKKGGKPGSAPYPDSKGAGSAGGKFSNNVFKMNKDLGQHILKNPGVAQAIVDKAGLKQSDVNFTFEIIRSKHVLMVKKDRIGGWSRYR